jgi:hypothetical protein
VSVFEKCIWKKIVKKKCEKSVPGKKNSEKKCEKKCEKSVPGKK